ncbi:MAG: hypothetical protein ABH834_00100 [Candidatus Altiarchaeota archaeon]
MRHKRIVKPKFPGPEAFDVEGESENVRELARLVAKMPAPLEAALNLSEDPVQCSMASMLIGEYLRSRGYHARLVPAYYTRIQPVVREQAGGFDAFLSALTAKSTGFLPVYKRSPKRFAAKLSSDGDSYQRAYQLLQMAQDSFVVVDLSGKGEGKEKFMVHGAYRQFMPPGKQDAVPPIVFDRVDAKTLKSRYHLVVSSPEQAMNIRSDERVFFSDQTPQGLTGFERDIRRMVRSRYRDFARRMDAL